MRDFIAYWLIRAARRVVVHTWTKDRQRPGVVTCQDTWPVVPSRKFNLEKSHGTNSSEHLARVGR
jgi:hypothetical protein